MTEPIVTEAGRRLLRMVATEDIGRGRRWPRLFDARLVERIVEEMIPAIEAEAGSRSEVSVRARRT